MEGFLRGHSTSDYAATTQEATVHQTMLQQHKAHLHSSLESQLIEVLNAFSQSMINSPVSTFFHKMTSSYSVELRFQSTPGVELPFNLVSKLNSADSLLPHKVALTVCWWEL